MNDTKSRTPKSPSSTFPASSLHTFEGFKLPWLSPMECRKASPCSTGFTYLQAVASGIGTGSGDGEPRGVERGDTALRAGGVVGVGGWSRSFSDPPAIHWMNT